MAYDQESHTSVSVPFSNSQDSRIRGNSSTNDRHYIETQSGVQFTGDIDHGSIYGKPQASGTLAQGTNTFRAEHSYQAGSERVGSSGSIWDSARTDSGSKPSKITGDTIVNYGGTSTSVAALANMGVLGMHPDGSYYEIGKPEWQTSNLQQRQPQGNHQPQQPHLSDSMSEQEQAKAMEQELKADWLAKTKGYSPEEVNLVTELETLRQQGHDFIHDDQTEIAINRVVGDLPGEAYLDTVSKMIEADGMQGVDWNHLSVTSGKPAEKCKEEAAMVRQIMLTKGQKVIEAEGVSDVNDFIRWASKTKPDAYKAAQREMFIERKSTITKDLAKAYLKAAPPPSAADFEKAGYETKQGPGGATVVNVPGHGWMTAENLTRMGAIKKGR